MSSALQICASAYRQARLDDLTSLSTTQDFPYNIALDLLNTVIQEVNRKANFWFTEIRASLTYTPGAIGYQLNTLGIDPNKIIRIRRENNPYFGELTPLSYRAFQYRYRMIAPPAGEPTAYAVFGNTLELNVIPNLDYGLAIYFYEDIPVIASDTDTIPCQPSDEDVFRDGVYAYLCERMGRPDFMPAYQAYMAKVMDLQEDNNQNSNIPSQMPANF